MQTTTDTETDHAAADVALEPGRPGDFKGTIPEDWVPLAEIAIRAGTKANVLRKHRVGPWSEQGLAAKDVAGNWWVALAALDTFEHLAAAAVAVEVPTAAVDALAALAGQGGEPAAQERPLSPAESEAHVAVAMRSLLALRPIPWPIVTKLCSMGRRYAAAPAEDSCTGS